MELKVYVDNVPKIVCNVTETTTCQEVIIALAHAIKRPGRYALIRRFRDVDYRLAPEEKPIDLLLQSGDYSTEVVFVLHNVEEHEQFFPISPIKHSSLRKSSTFNSKNIKKTESVQSQKSMEMLDFVSRQRNKLENQRIALFQAEKEILNYETLLNNSRSKSMKTVSNDALVRLDNDIDNLKKEIEKENFKHDINNTELSKLKHQLNEMHKNLQGQIDTQRRLNMRIYNENKERDTLLKEKERLELELFKTKDIEVDQNINKDLEELNNSLLCQKEFCAKLEKELIEMNILVFEDTQVILNNDESFIANNQLSPFSVHITTPHPQGLWV